MENQLTENEIEIRRLLSEAVENTGYNVDLWTRLIGGMDELEAISVLSTYPNTEFFTDSDELIEYFAESVRWEAYDGYLGLSDCEKIAYLQDNHLFVVIDLDGGIFAYIQ